MREIKFRAWDGNKMNCDLLDFSLSELLFQDMEVWEVMQYTGLKDKNGVEIYEGDIVIGLRDGTLDYSKQRAIIEFKGGAFRENYFNRSVGDYINCSYGYGNILEVIGNIYENPELLEVKNES